MLEMSLPNGANLPSEMLQELTQVYQALKKAAVRENNLHAFLAAELSLVTLEECRYRAMQPQCYAGTAHYLKAEPTDTAEQLFEHRCRFVYNAPCGA